MHKALKHGKFLAKIKYLLCSVETKNLAQHAVRPNRKTKQTHKKVLLINGRESRNQYTDNSQFALVKTHYAGCKEP